VLLALVLLGESIHLLQFLGITAIVAGVMFMYRQQRQNLRRCGHGPVALVAPLVASYLLVTLLLSFVFLKHEHIGPQLVAAVAVIVSGVVLLIVA